MEGGNRRGFPLTWSHMFSLRKSVISIAAIIFVASLFAEKFVGFYVDWLWFGSQGLQSVMWTTMSAQYGVGILSGVIFFLVTFGALR